MNSSICGALQQLVYRCRRTRDFEHLKEVLQTRWEHGQDVIDHAVIRQFRKPLSLVVATGIWYAHYRYAIQHGQDQTTCTKCDTVLTVKHILLDCPELQDVRLKYFTASSLKDSFESVDNQDIIGFIKDAHFYH